MARQENKRAETGRTPARGRSQVFRNDAGDWRTGWRFAFALAVYLCVSFLVRLGMSRGLSALFSAWNVDARNVLRAPLWARRFFAWQGSLTTLIVDAVLIALSLWIRRWWMGRGRVRKLLKEGSGRRAALCWTAGTLAALLSAAIFLKTDSIRPEWPLASPHFTKGLLALWVLNLLTVLSEELFTRGVIFDGLRATWGVGWATAISTAIFFLSNGGYAGNVLCAVNVALFGVLCCRIYARHGLMASVCLRWGWSFATVFLLGYGGGAHALYRMYGVSEGFLTGGDAGFVYGLWMTIMLAVLLSVPVAWRIKKRRMKS